MYLAQSQTQSTCTQHSQRYSLHVPSTVTYIQSTCTQHRHRYSLHVPSTVTDTVYIYSAQLQLVYMYLAQSQTESICT